MPRSFILRSRFLRNIAGISFFFALLSLAALGHGQESSIPEATNGESQFSQEELEALIRLKSDALERINRELESTNENLRSTQQEKTTLERELRSLQGNINQLELNIRSDELTSQKLSLEVDSLKYDIRDIELTIKNKEEAIGHVLREIQRNDGNNLLMIFLKNESLADGFWETQSLKSLREQLAVDIENLSQLHEELNDKVTLVDTKRLSIDLHRKTLTNRKSIVQDQKETRNVILAQTKNKESTYQQQLDDLKKQQEAISEEIDKIEEQLRESFDVALLPVERPGVLVWPIPLRADGGAGSVTQHFGAKSNLYRGRPHNGLDIGAPIGTPVVAADDGIVMAADNNDRSSWSKYQYGKYVVIRHKTGLATLYAHLSKYSVTKGEEVKRGQIIGYSGNSGYTTGPHLHFGLYWAPSIQFKSVPPAAGLVPIGVVIGPEKYL